MNKKIYGISGSGAVGVHPLAKDAWSGSSAFFFGEIAKRNALQGTFGGEIPFIHKLFFALKNYSSDPAILRRRMYMDVGYRRALSRLMSAKIKGTSFEADAASIQIGSMFDIKDAINDHCLRLSYNDGNFIMSLQSPYFPKAKISDKKIEAAINFEKQVLSGLHHILTMSEYLKQSFVQDYGVSEDRVHCIGAGINIAEAEIKEMLRQSNLSDKDYDRPNVLFIGVDFVRKGGLHLLRAFRKVRKAVPQACLNIVGPKHPHEGFAAEPGVVWHGFLNKGEQADLQKLRTLLCDSSLFVMPSLYEPFGIAPLEAMLNKIPCLVSDSWALPEIVPAGLVGELVEPQNEELLAEKIICLLKSPETLKRYGDAGPKWVLDNFLWNKVVDRLERFLETV